MNFKQRYNAFWNWFVNQEEQIRGLMDEKKYDEANWKLKEQLQKLMPNLFFEISCKDNVYTLELSSMGDNISRIIIYCLVINAPSSLYKHWRFYSSRIAKKGKLNFQGRALGGEDITVFPIFDKRNKTFKIKVICSSLEGISDEEKFSIIYLMLYEYVGEILTESCISEVEFINKFAYNLRYKNYKSIPLSQLAEYIKNILGPEKVEDISKNGLIYEYFTGRPNLSINKDRYDIEKGYSALMQLNHEYYSEHSNTNEMLRNIGIKACYLCLGNEELDDKIINKIKEKVDMLLKGRGIQIGCARGKQNTYIDTLIYDDGIVEFNDIKADFPALKLRFEEFNQIK